jgi:acetylglutamate kinase
MQEITIIKIGGETLNDLPALDRCLDTVAAATGPVILVHGGGRKVTELAGVLGIGQQIVDGRRITSAETLELCVMVYAGLINKTLVAALSARGRKAIGLTGADMGCIRAVRRTTGNVDFGLVGDIERVDTEVLAGFLERGVVPVICSITLGQNDELLNTNADTMAASIATAFASDHPVRLAYCFTHSGVLRDIDDPHSVFPVITPDDIERLRTEGVIAGGMVPKLDTAANAVRQGVREIRILHSDALGQFLDHRPAGTAIHQP